MDRYQHFNESLRAANAYQLAVHKEFEGRFSGSTKASIPHRAYSDPAFARLNAHDFAQQLVMFYENHSLLGKKLEKGELFILGFPKEDPKVIRLEVIPLQEGTIAPFYVATKNRERVLNEVEVGHNLKTRSGEITDRGYKTVARVCKDIEVILEELQGMLINGQFMPSHLINQTRNHPIHDHNPDKQNTLCNVYGNRVVTSTNRGIESHEIASQGLFDFLKRKGIEQELIDAYQAITGHLPMNGEIRRDFAGKNTFSIRSYFERGPTMALLLKQGSDGDTVEIQHEASNRVAREISAKTLTPIALIADQLHRRRD